MSFDIIPSLQDVTREGATTTVQSYFTGGLGVGAYTGVITSKFAVNGNAVIGSGYNLLSAPTNGLLVQGNVGIGTSTPSSLLHIKSATNAHSNLIIDNTTSNYNSALNFALAGSQKWAIGMNKATADGLDFFDTVNSVARMVIKPSGNIGINITNPNLGTLVVKNINDSTHYQYQGINDNGNTNFLFTQNPAGDALYSLYKNGSSIGSPDVQVSTNGNSWFNGGNVGIGATNPTSRLDVIWSSNASTFAVQTSSNSTSISIGQLLAPSGAWDMYFTVGNALTNTNSALIGFSVTWWGKYAFLTTYWRPASDLAVHTSGNVTMGTTTDITAYGGAKLQVRWTGSSVWSWKGRVVAWGDNATFLMGEYNSWAWLGAHNGALSAWADLYIQWQGGKDVFVWYDGTTFSATRLVASTIAIGVAAPSAAAAMQIDSTNRWFLPPRMTTTQRTAITAVAGLIVYDTTTNKSYTYDGTAWQAHF